MANQGIHRHCRRPMKQNGGTQVVVSHDYLSSCNRPDSKQDDCLLVDRKFTLFRALLTMGTEINVASKNKKRRFNRARPLELIYPILVATCPGDSDC